MSEHAAIADHFVEKHKGKLPLSELDSLRRQNVPQVQAFYENDIVGPIEAQRPVVADIMNPNELQVWFGASGAKKTFVVVDLSMSVATGTQWCGCTTTKSPVVILSSEGGANIRRRLKAWCKGKGVSLDGASIAVITVPIDLFAEIKVFRRFILEFEERTGKWPGLVVVDTLAMSSSADENSANEIGGLLANIKTAAGGAAVLMVHHSGLSDKDRERGSYVLRASADRTVRVESAGDGLVELHCVKSKDDEPFSTITLRPRGVELPDLDVYGQPLSSMVVDHVETVARLEVGPKRRLNDDARLASRLLREHIAKEGQVHSGASDLPPGTRVLPVARWKKLFRDSAPPDDARGEEARRKAFERAITSLQAAGMAAVVDGHAFVREVHHARV